MFEEPRDAAMRSFVRTGWAFIFLATAAAVAWFAVNNVEAVRSAWADLRGEKAPTWGDVGAKIQEFMDQQPIVLPRTEPTPPPPVMTPAPPAP